VEFRVLGPLEVRRDGEVLELRGSKRRAVLAILILHLNEVVRTDRLIDEVWGNDPPANASAAVQSHISRLRKDLGTDLLITKPWGYVLRAEPGTVDLVRFERLVAEAKPLAAEERVRLLTRALELWRGPPLADLARESGLAQEVARLEELRVAALEQRIDAELELGRHDELIAELEALVAEHPLRERLRGQLILALYRADRQAEALETYRETRRVLVEELGIEPGPLLRELERAVLRQDPVLVSPPPISSTETVSEGDDRRWRWPRSPLMVALVLLLLGGIGAAAAVLATRGALRPGVGAAVPDAKYFPTSTVVTRESTAAHVAHKRVPYAAPRVATTTRKGTTSRSPHRAANAARPRAAQRRRPAAAIPNSVYTPQRKVYWLVDDFERPGADPHLWYVDDHGTGAVEATEHDGRLELSVAPQSVAGKGRFDTRYGTLCRVRGDFDARVDYKLLSWPPGNGVSLTLGAYLGSWLPPNDFMWVSRAGAATGGTETYSTQVRSNARAFATLDTTGALRITRIHGLVSTYYRRDELLYSGEVHRRWVKLASATAPYPANLILMLNSSSDQFGGLATAAAFDNFQATADGVLCDGAAIPPLRPRP
jgi:DNA-binding SARP family transcriptional activator